MNEDDIKDAINQIGLNYSQAKEHWIETFEELAENDIEGALKVYDHFLKSTLNVGNGFFRGHGVGGPPPEITGRFLNILEKDYHSHERNLREKILNKGIKTIYNKSTDCAQYDLELIDNPWFAADILVYCPPWYCGYEKYADVLEKCNDWSDFMDNVIKTDETGVTSFADFVSSRFWLARAVADIEVTSDSIRERFEEEFAELTDLTKDAIAALIDNRARLLNAVSGEMHEDYDPAIEKRIKRYDPRWEYDLRRKIDEHKWIVLPESERRYDPKYWEQ